MSERSSDAEARERALDPTGSFVVQAPAGSGKTGLLIQRTLTLLANAESPEEVLAITFTRKAAAEMRERVVHALNGAQAPAPSSDYERITWERARAVVARDEELGWGLTLNPSRLRIMTIDALCASLVAQMPVLSKFGATLDVVSQPVSLYLRAARRLLGSLENDESMREDLQVLMQHLDNNQARIESLLIDMLRHRDRWLPLVAGAQRPDLTRAALEDTLRLCTEQGLSQAANALPDHLVELLIDVVAQAARRCSDDHPLHACAALDAIPAPDLKHRPLWEGIAEFVLTQKDTVRKTVNAKLGVLAPSGTKDATEKEARKVFKEQAVSLLALIAEAPDFVAALAEVRRLPPGAYTEEEWGLLLALQTLLPVAAAQLKVLFQERGQIDFVEQSHRALGALGTDDEPTDLALALDYRIAHLLIDEFQDTSRTQYELVERLVTGWQHDDGRTLFLVGDPMQSIYRFRDAEVGLFLRARAHGIGDVALEPLTLTANFRSRAGVVERNNSVFARIFPDHESVAESAVCYTSAHAQRETGGDVYAHAFDDDGGAQEATKVVALVEEALDQKADSTVAILVRNRSHLVEILPALTRAGHAFHAVDILALKTSSVVIDLWALTRALLHLGDRTAWLSILRSPWCGLTLTDLFALAGGDSPLTVWELIINESRRDALSDDGKVRLSRVKMVMAKALAEKGRRDLRRWVEGCWTALGGPACVLSKVDLDNALTFFDLLEKFENDGGFDSLEDLERAVDGLFADTRADASTRLNVMTIHKAKGLEFDTVIIPGLHRTGANDRRAMLQWLELTDDAGTTRRLLAPINASEAQDPIGRYVSHVQRRRDRAETLRLLYVAATRARYALHWLTRVGRDTDGDVKAPAESTLAGMLWPALGDEFAASLDTQTSVEQDVATVSVPAVKSPSLVRVPTKWMLPQAPQPTPWRGSEVILPVDTDRRADWAGDSARHVGTTVHRVLQQIAEEGVDQWMGRWMDGLDDYLGRMLSNLGVLPGELADAKNRAGRAVRNCLTDERGRWLLRAHTKSRCELPLSGWIDGRVRNVVLDRTFVDDQGDRWIVDYKSAQHKTGTDDAFMDAQLEQYRPQLDLYARIMHRVDPVPIHLGLYFPLLQGWREWRFDSRRDA
ncbi:MAG: UvrD-helicase domain-containing protein [Gammaproteobacteria bacterium]